MHSLATVSRPASQLKTLKTVSTIDMLVKCDIDSMSRMNELAINQTKFINTHSKDFLAKVMQSKSWLSFGRLIKIIDIILFGLVLLYLKICIPPGTPRESS